MVEIEEKPADATDDIDSPKARRDQLVNDYLDTREAINKHTVIAAQLAQQIATELGVGGKHEVLPGVGVRVQAPAAVFNAAKARKVLTDAQYTAICELKPSATRAELMLPDLLVNQCRVAAGHPSIRSL